VGVYRERDLLERLLREANSCFDDLVVVHDGPEEVAGSEGLESPAPIDYATLPKGEPLPGGYRRPLAAFAANGMQRLVEEYGGRCFEGGRSFQQEPHWPFAWSQARHDWILRLDADEFPSAELREWLRRFRQLPDSIAHAGYTCIWPLWDGKRAATKNWPAGRNFLFDRRKVRFFGMVEQVPVPDGDYEETGLVLHHQPRRKSYGVRNIVFRSQAFQWRRVIARSLMGKPTDLPRWRWNSEHWPQNWEHLRRHPLRHSMTKLIRYPMNQLRDMIAARELPRLSACLNPGLHHFMLGIRVFNELRKIGKPLP
jgi:hypothetical protein